MQRSAGILLPISSLPSPYGIGCFSQEAYDFVDWLKEAGQTYWQILPLGVTSYGDSPYQSFSAFAGNPYFISLDALVEEGVLTADECKKANFGRKADDINYSRLYTERGRDIADDPDAFAVGVGFQPAPLLVELELEILVVLHLKIQLPAVVVHGGLPAQTDILGPLDPRLALKAALHRGGGGRSPGWLFAHRPALGQSGL